MYSAVSTIVTYIIAFETFVSGVRVPMLVRILNIWLRAIILRVVWATALRLGIISLGMDIILRVILRLLLLFCKFWE